MTRLLLLFFLVACCGPLPKAPDQIGVTSYNYHRPLEAAVSIWNSFVGCEIFVPGADVVVEEVDGHVCAVWHHHHTLENNHAAGAYKCSEGWEIQIAYPGDIYTQTCIVAHELGHVLGLRDGGRGIMGGFCPEDAGVMLRPSTREIREVRARHCHP